MKILVAYDGSRSADLALRTATAYAGPFGASVLVVTSLYGKHETTREDVNQARERLDDALALVKNEGLAGEQHLLIRGLQPGEDIVAFAKENEVDQIVIGARRRSKIGKLVFGSNAQYIILKAHCPVVTVK